MSARESFLAGVRRGIPFAAVGAVLSLSFAVLARQAGFTPLQAIVTSALVFAGSAQFAALAVLTGGGAAGAAVAAGTLMNGRFLAMGVAIAPSLPGGPVLRAIQGQTMIDASWAMANRGDGTYDRWLMFGSTLPQYCTWVLGSVVGSYAGNVLDDPSRWGLDAVFPTFFLAILLGELRRPRARVAAGLGAAIALALTPFAPPGVPIMLAAAAALVGLATPPDAADAEGEEDAA